MKILTVLILVLLISASAPLFPKKKLTEEQLKEIEAGMGSLSGLEKVESLRKVARGYWYKNPKKSVSLAQEALLILNKEEDLAKRTDVLVVLGGGHYLSGDYKNALDAYSQALEIAEQRNDRLTLASCLNNIGVIYDESKNLKKALEYYRRALELAEEMKDYEKIATYLNNIGIIHFQTKSFDKSLDFFQRSLEIGKKYEYKIIVEMCLINIGDYYNNKKDYEKSLVYMRQALKVSKEVKDLTGVCASLTNIAANLRKLGRYEEARRNLEKSLEISKKNSLKQYVMDSLKEFFLIYRDMKDFRQALDYHEKYIKLKEEIFSEANAKKIADLQVKYETEKKEKDNEILRRQNSTQELKLQKFHNLRIIFSLVFLFVLALLIVIYSRYHMRRKMNLVLADKNRQLNLSNDKLKELNLTKDKFFSIIAHDLRNPLNSLFSVSELLLEAFPGMSQEKLKSFLSRLYSGSRHLSALLENLLRWAQSQTGKITVQPETLNLKKICEETGLLLEENAGAKEIDLEIAVSEELTVKADREMTQTVLRNLASNAVKFTSKQGKVCFEGVERKGEVEISLRDNGVGIGKDNVDKLFRLEGDFSRKGTAGESGTGIGLLICKEFVEMNGGKIGVESEEQVGSRFFFTLPKG